MQLCRPMHFASHPRVFHPLPVKRGRGPFQKSLSNTLKELGKGAHERQPPTTGARLKPGSFLTWISLAKQDDTGLRQTPSKSEVREVNRSHLEPRCGSVMLTSMLLATVAMNLLCPLASSLTLCVRRGVGARPARRCGLTKCRPPKCRHTAKLRSYVTPVGYLITTPHPQIEANLNS